MVCMFTFSSWYGTTSASRRKGLRIGSANIRNRERSAVLTANSVGAFGAATSCINLILSIVLLRRFSVSLEQLTDCTPTGDVLGCRQVGRILTKKKKGIKKSKANEKNVNTFHEDGLPEYLRLQKEIKLSDRKKFAVCP